MPIIGGGKEVTKMTIEATPKEIAALIRELQEQPIPEEQPITRPGIKGTHALDVPSSLNEPTGNCALHISENTDCGSKIRLSVGNGNEGGIEYIPRTDEGIKRIIALIDSSITEVSIQKEPMPNAPNVLNGTLH